MIGIKLVYYQGHSWWLAVAPLLLVLGAFFIGPGQLALARLRWDEIFYALTDISLEGYALQKAYPFIGDEVGINDKEKYTHFGELSTS